MPSTEALFVTWLFMAATGLLLAEVNTNQMDGNTIEYSDGIPARAGFGQIVRKCLGNNIASISSVFYVLIHYSLLVAYISEAGVIFEGALRGLGLFPVSWLGAAVFTFSSGTLLVFGSSNLVGLVNNVAVFVVLSTFAAIIFEGSAAVDYYKLIEYGNYEAVWSTIPIMLLSLVFHNVIPTVCNQLAFDKKRIQIAIVIGSFLPLLMFISWNGVILGLATDGSARSGVDDPVSMLRLSTENSAIGILISVFSEFAIFTSFIGFSLGLINFFLDVFPNKSDRDPLL